VTVARHRRSGIRHRIADDDLVTLCGRILRRTKFVREQGEPNCGACRNVAARGVANASEPTRAAEGTPTSPEGRRASDCSIQEAGA
jgi:hypothetical protein